MPKILITNKSKITQMVGLLNTVFGAVYLPN